MAALAMKRQQDSTARVRLDTLAHFADRIRVFPAPARMAPLVHTPAMVDILVHAPAASMAHSAPSISTTARLLRVQTVVHALMALIVGFASAHRAMVDFVAPKPASFV